MEISIGCRQEFQITLTEHMVAMLIALSSTHYDGVCRDASLVGRFLFGWKNQILWWKESDGAEELPTPRITNRDLQTCLKICENPMPLEQHLIDAKNDFVRFGFAALRQADADGRFGHLIPVEL